jgi:tetratricopeptide (TPR) repeat protein
MDGSSTQGVNPDYITAIRQFASGSACVHYSTPMLSFFRAAATLLLVPAAGATAQTPGVPDTTPGYYFLLGRHLENEGRIDEAIAAHRRAIELEPQSAELRAELAGLYARQDRAAEALEAAEAALQRDAANREANRILGSTYAAFVDQKQPIRRGDDPSQYAARAIASLEKARGDGAVDLSLELMLGRLYLRTDAFDKAIPPLRRVFDEQRSYGEAALLLASAYQGAKRTADATTTLEAAVAENPRFYRGYLQLAELYDDQRRWKDAAAAYATAQSLNPRADLSVRRAAALLNAGDTADAMAMLQAVMKKDPAKPDPAALFLLTHVQRQMKDLPAAATTAETLRKMYPDDIRGLYATAAVLESQERYAEAATILKDLMARAPEDSTIVHQYANALDKSGRAADAEAALRGLISRDPRDANALNSLGYMFAERGVRLDEAVELLQRALKIEPENASFLDSLGWAYLRQGRLDLADGPLAAAAARMPDNSVIQDHLGDLRYRQQRFAEAVAAWQRSLAGDGDSIDRAAVQKKLRDAQARVGK